MTEEERIKEKLVHLRTWQGRFFTSLILLVGALSSLLLRGLETTLEKWLFWVGVLVFFGNLYVLVRVEVIILRWLR